MAALIAERVSANLAAVRARIAAAAQRAGRDPDSVTVVAATKYLSASEVALLATAGITDAGENRAQELVEKVAVAPELRWHFIGALQSRKVRDVAPRVHMIHSVSSESVLHQLARWAPEGLEILIEVNVAGEATKVGIRPRELARYLERAPVPVVGLMTMPPHTDDPQRSRPYFAALRELAAEHGLAQLSCGTTQDFEVAVEEGATFVRIGTNLYR
jgi:pyridoxal phosphate enzyme (YggS family)